jgi:hypothetical protein
MSCDPAVLEPVEWAWDRRRADLPGLELVRSYRAAAYPGRVNSRAVVTAAATPAAPGDLEQ